MQFSTACEMLDSGLKSPICGSSRAGAKYFRTYAYRHENNSSEGRKVRCPLEGYTAREWNARLFNTLLIILFVCRQVGPDLYHG